MLQTKSPYVEDFRAMYNSERRRMSYAMGPDNDKISVYYGGYNTY